MNKTAVVFGSTGVQGGGVVQALLKDGVYKVRGVTRNPESSNATVLSSQGVEMVRADYDDTDSLAKAINGAHAVFAVTQFWDYISANGAIKAGEIERRQAINLAEACAASTSLEHYIWSTLPSGAAATNGKVFVPHIEYKASVDEYIKDKLPELAKKTTFLWVGYYATNMASFPALKPHFVEPLQKHVYVQPTPPTTILPIAGDCAFNTGLFVRAILAHPEVSLPGRYTSVQTESLSHGEILELWRRVTKNEVVYLQCTAESFDRLYPGWGTELALQFEWNALVPDWSIPGMVTAEELGITGLIGWEKALKNLGAELK